MEEKIPHKISEYIQEHFREDFLTEITTLKSAQGQTLYKVEVTQNNLQYHLMFNEKGDIVKEEADPLFPQDNHEDTNLDEGYYPDEKDF